MKRPAAAMERPAASPPADEPSQKAVAAGGASPDDGAGEATQGPLLYLFDPCSASKLSSRHFNWGSTGDGASDCESDEDQVCERGRRHSSMESAPEAARAIAQKMQRLLGGVGHAPILTELDRRIFDERDGDPREITGVLPTKTDAIVVSPAGPCVKDAVRRALGIVGRLRGAVVGARDWRRDVIGDGFARAPEAEGRFDEKVVALTDLMATALTDHFEFAYLPQGDVAIACEHLAAGDGAEGAVRCRSLAGEDVATLKVPAGEEPFGEWLARGLLGKLGTEGRLRLVKPNREMFWSAEADDNSVTPVVYGGLASDGSIVGLLASRVNDYERHAQRMSAVASTPDSIRRFAYAGSPLPSPDF